MRIMNVIIIFLFDTILFSLISSTCLGSALNKIDYIEGLNVRIFLNTTSDWTQIEFANVPVCLIEDKVTKSASSLKLKKFYIVKSSYDSTEVEVNYRIFIKDLQKQEDIILYIKKGNIGKTTVTFLNEDQVIGQFENNLNIAGDPTNKKTLLVKKDFFHSCKLVKQQIIYPECPKLVMAFYYPWYENPEGPHKRWFHWEPDKHYASVHTPTLGYYDSADTMVIRKHIEFAELAGIDGFIISWWGQETPSDTVTSKIFEIAEKTNFKVTIYYEQADKLEDVVNDIKYLLKKYGRFSSFLQIQEKPVIFYYGRTINKFTLKEWKEIFSQLRESELHTCNIAETMGVRILSVFDGLHIYNNMDFKSLAVLNQSLSGTAYIQGKIFGATVIPGYNDTLVNSPGAVVERLDGKYYSQAWKSALTSNPDIILITSFNEWHEGTEIEPSQEYGMKYLNITRKYTDIFKTRKNENRN